VLLQEDLKIMNDSLQNGPSFLQTCISKLFVTYFSNLSLQARNLLQQEIHWVFPNISQTVMLVSPGIFGAVQGRASRLADSALRWIVPATVAEITGNFGVGNGNLQQYVIMRNAALVSAAEA